MNTPPKYTGEERRSIKQAYKPYKGPERRKSARGDGRPQQGSFSYPGPRPEPKVATGTLIVLICSLLVLISFALFLFFR